MKFITKLQRISLKAQVYEYLKQAIINGDLKVGEIYSEQYFADKLSISRTPVREAILQLQHENMVEVKANRGIIVKPLLLDEIKKIIETRLAIEGVNFTNNNYFSEIIKMLRSRLEIATLKSLHETNRLNDALNEHYLLVNDIKSGDSQKAFQAFKFHMQKTLEIMEQCYDT